MLDSLVINLGKDDFKYLSQKFNNKVLDLVKQKGFYSFEQMWFILKSLKKNCQARKGFIVFWSIKK